MAEFRNAWLVASWLAAWLGLAAVAHAQTTSAAAAESLFRAGRDALAHGDAKSASSKFYESYRLDPAVGTLLNIAACDEALGQLSAAWQHFDEVVHALPARDDRVAYAQQHLTALESRLPRVKLRLAERAPADTHARVGQLELGSASFDVALPFNPGEYDVEVRAQGHEPEHYHLSVHEGDRLELEIAPGAAQAAIPSAATPAASKVGIAAPPATPSKSPMTAVAPPPAERPAIADEPDHTLAFVLMGVGGASLVASAVTLGLMLDRARVVRENCDVNTSKCKKPAGLSAASAGTAFYITSVTTLAVGLVSGGLGTYLWLSDSESTPSSQAKLRLTPMLGPDVAYLGASGQF